MVCKQASDLAKQPFGFIASCYVRVHVCVSECVESFQNIKKQNLNLLI